MCIAFTKFGKTCRNYAETNSCTCPAHSNYFTDHLDHWRTIVSNPSSWKIQRTVYAIEQALKYRLVTVKKDDPLVEQGSAWLFTFFAKHIPSFDKSWNPKAFEASIRFAFKSCFSLQEKINMLTAFVECSSYGYVLAVIVSVLKKWKEEDYKCLSYYESIVIHRIVDSFLEENTSLLHNPVAYTQLAMILKLYKPSWETEFYNKVNRIQAKRSTHSCSNAA